ncbi:hypothetical protein MP638_005976 [Amoeboaphelidium occidentale]|nr:hypothetical protein MP638_005976 [Amoeboaphelidium occidentale]
MTHKRSTSVTTGPRQKSVLSFELKRSLSFSGMKPYNAFSGNLKNTEQPSKAKQVKGVLKSNSTKDRMTIPFEKKPSKKFRFNETVLVGECFNAEDYDRKSDFTLTLTPEIAYMIKRELNEFKTQEMPVHEGSKQFTHLFRL